MTVTVQKDWVWLNKINLKYNTVFGIFHYFTEHGPLISRSQFEYAAPNPAPVPKTNGQALRLNRTKDNTAPEIFRKF